MRKVILVLLILTATRTLISCCGELDVNFQWGKVLVRNVDLTTAIPKLAVQDSSRIDTYGFLISLQGERVAHQPLPDFGISRSYALSCDKYYHNTDSITRIEVTTRNSFDNTHPAGSFVTDYVFAVGGSGLSSAITVPFSPVNSNLSFVNTDSQGFDSQLVCKFQNASPFLGPHQFIVSVIFKSGRVLMDTTAVRFY